MTPTLILELPLKAQAKERPRLGPRGTYTPQRTRVFERSTALIAEAQAKAQRWQMLDVPCGARVWIEGSRIRGDLDNCCKSILDGLNGIAYTDDSLVRELYARMPIAKKHLPKWVPKVLHKFIWWVPQHRNRILVHVWPLDLTKPIDSEEETP